MSTYLWINIAVIFFPLVLSFDKKLQFYKRIPAFIVSLLFAGGGFIIWDIYATIHKHWSFSPAHTFKLKFMFLPLEELLFFLAIPYACIFLYETISYYLPKRELPFNIYFNLSVAVIPAFIALLIFETAYTQIVIWVAIAFFVTATIFYPSILKSSHYWIYMLFSFVPFFVVNYILTSIPIVSYNPDVIIGYRITSIPVEDFIYSYSMLSWYLLIYLAARDIWTKIKKQ